MTETVGSFLVSKLNNMARWVQAEVSAEELGSEVIAELNRCRTGMEATLFAEALLPHSEAIDHHNWDALVDIPDLPKGLIGLIDCIRKREDLHDKFWRYLELFTVTVRA